MRRLDALRTEHGHRVEVKFKFCIPFPPARRWHATAVFPYCIIIIITIIIIMIVIIIITIIVIIIVC